MTEYIKSWNKVKESNRDALVFYRIGDFYELLFEDAETAARELDLTLTHRDFSETKRVAMCGVPFHSVDKYIAKLIEKGYKIAVCEQAK